MNLNRLIFCVWLLAVAACSARAGQTVAAAAKPGKGWKDYPVRTLADLPETVRTCGVPALSRFGGLTASKSKATGFFRTEFTGGRWWLIDPEGCRFISMGMSSVGQIRTSAAEAALTKRFGTETNWAAQTVAQLRAAGFNTAGAWSDQETLRATGHPLPYTRLVNFMSAYGKKRGGTFQQPGHIGYPEDCIFVFDPGFETFCAENAQQLLASKDDPWLIGYFSDNEMPFKLDALRKYLRLPAEDPGYKAALAWLQLRHGAGATTNQITSRDEHDFLLFVADKYFSTVAQAIKHVDPNHLYLGSRFYGGDKGQPELFKAAGRWVDVVSVNYYNAWTPEAEKMTLWLHEAKKPFLVTEWYAKGEDSGLANTGGAGWLVKTQRDRGRFYQHFALGLLEAPGCVGWCWLKYIDNDPEDKRADPSNRDSNKGIVNNRYEPYVPLIEAMSELNAHAYAAAGYFSGAPSAAPKVHHDDRR